LGGSSWARLDQTGFSAILCPSRSLPFQKAQPFHSKKAIGKHMAGADTFISDHCEPTDNMTGSARNVAVLGSTGSIGVNALAVIGASGGRLRAIMLSAHSKTGLALEQAIRHRPRWLAITDEQAAAKQDWSSLPRETELVLGHDALVALVGSRGSVSAADPANGNVAANAGRSPTAELIDVVLAAMVGSVGLRSTWAALEAGRRVALANKETLVMAGPQVMRLAATTGADLLPVDSEHSAIFQCLKSGQRLELRRIILTASGGPFRRHSPAELARVTVEDALRHPNWNMGPKITVDSATMMNKALEMIEARWLFDLCPNQIDVVIHPQSIVHSMVEFNDGSVIAQLSPPDMKLPIQYALCYPDRLDGPSPRLDLGRTLCLEFEPPDEVRFPALRLGREAAAAGGTAGAVLNAANEAAVSCFLSGRLPFFKIVPACQHALDRHSFESNPTLTRLFELDAWAREEIERWARN
jgi:1-deoxy-D-xylulose-5-phosphate reductoisomerase